MPAGQVLGAFKRRARTQRTRTEAPRSAYTRDTLGRADWRGPLAVLALKVRGFLSDRTVLAKLSFRCDSTPNLRTSQSIRVAISCESHAATLLTAVGVGCTVDLAAPGTITVRTGTEADERGATDEQKGSVSRCAGLQMTETNMTAEEGENPSRSAAPIFAGGVVGFHTQQTPARVEV